MAVGRPVGPGPGEACHGEPASRGAKVALTRVVLAARTRSVDRVRRAHALEQDVAQRVAPRASPSPRACRASRCRDAARARRSPARAARAARRARARRRRARRRRSCPRRAPSTSARSSTTAPRAVFTSTAVGRIAASAAASIRWCVSAVSGQWRLTTSASASTALERVAAPGEERGRAERLGEPRRLAADPARPDHAEALALEALAEHELEREAPRLAGAEHPVALGHAAEQRERERDRELGGRAREHVRRVRDDDAARAGGGEVDVVDADAVVGDDLQPGAGLRRGRRRRPSSSAARGSRRRRRDRRPARSSSRSAASIAAGTGPVT